MERVSKQLILSTQSGRLKPEVRLGVAVSEFAQTLDDDRKREFRKMQTAGTQLSGRDAIRVTEELNRDSERRHCTWRPYGTKCGKFLDRLQTLANIGDVMIGGSQNVIATSVWCAVRLSLQTATNFRGYFERLSSLFMKLGTSWELRNDFAQIFPQSEALQTFLCEYLIVLMRLCRKAVLFSNKSLAGQLWSSLGASFDSEFKPLQEEMDRWGLMIQYKTQQLATASVVDTERFRRRDYKQRLLHLLSPNQPQHITTWRRHRRKGDCKWIYQTAAYKSWIAEDASSTLCISGKLGSGKTVTMANIVARINMHKTCAFFFCTFKDQESLKAINVLGSIAFHLLDSIPGDDSTWDVLSRQKDTASRVLTSTGIIRLLTDLLPEHERYVVVFDGLEDCPDDEITEVIYGLRRLMTHRIVLLCYSARSGSMFQRLTVQKLAAKLSLSLDEKMHDDEIKAYITEEVARRKQTSQPGLFSDELVELIQKQLLAGAQGMYLWVSLQLESIFPSQFRTVVTYEQILNLINNLPKDLPEAFERALEGIIDSRYGDSIMKIIMAARSPLSLDELRVALAVVPGDPVWYAAKVPTNASQLISLCGGNLLEQDEEDGKVRFINSSVVSHLLQTTKNPRTMLYHFTLPEAEIHSGAICVTFLNMPIFETGITMTRKIDGARLAEEVIGTATQEHPLLSHLAHLFKKTDRRQSQSMEFDIGRLLAEIQATKMLKFDQHCFQDYAVSNWLPHSRLFERKNPMCMNVWHLWIRLLRGHIQVAGTPFPSPVSEPWPALSWALNDHHRTLVYAIFDELAAEPLDGESISHGVINLRSSSPAKNYDPSSLGLIMVHLLQHTVDLLATERKIPVMLLLYESLGHLLDWGADLTIPHSRTKNNILKILLVTLGYILETTGEGRQLCALLMRALACDNGQLLLRSAWVPNALQRILQQDNTHIFLTLLSHVPRLHLEDKQTSLFGVAVAKRNVEAVRALITVWPEGGVSPAQSSCVNGQPAIQLALEMQNKEMVVLLARHGGFSTREGRMQFSPSLLQISLERMSVEWVELLLQLGADPNLGYPAPAGSSFAHTHTGHLYHLESTAARSQTLKFLTLVRYGANPLLSISITPIITHHDNRVLMARLKELHAWSRRMRPPSSALLEACRMLALHMNEDRIFKHFGLVQMHDATVLEKEQELELILLDLVKTTESGRLNLECQEGNTALHYLTGGMDRFHRQALAVASHLLASDCVHLGLTLRNKNGQTPLHRAIDNGARNDWRRPYIDSFSFLLSHIQTMAFSKQWLTGSDDSILVFSISKGAPVEDVIRVLLGAGSDPNGRREGVTPLEAAVNMPAFRYACMVTTYLLCFGADPSVKCSRGVPLLNFVATERRDWLRSLVDKLQPYQASMTQSDPFMMAPRDVRELAMSSIYELADTSATRLWSLEPHTRHIPPRFWPHLSAYQNRIHDSPPVFSGISTECSCDEEEGTPIHELEDTQIHELEDTSAARLSSAEEQRP